MKSTHTHSPTSVVPFIVPSTKYSAEYGTSYMHTLSASHGSKSAPSIPNKYLLNAWSRTFYQWAPHSCPLEPAVTKILAGILLIPDTHYFFTQLPKLASSPRSIVNLFGSEHSSLAHIFGILGPKCVYKHGNVL